MKTGAEAVGGRRDEVVPSRSANAVRVVAERPTAKDPVLTTRVIYPWAAIGRRTGVACVIIIFYPLPYIACHIAEPLSRIAGRVGTYRRGCAGLKVGLKGLKVPHWD
jgi:hypothetical protein